MIQCSEKPVAAGRVFLRHALAPLMLAAVLSSDFAYARQSLSAGGIKGSQKHPPCRYWLFTAL